MQVPRWLMRQATYRASGSGRYRVENIGNVFADDRFAVIRELKRWRLFRLGWTWVFHFCHSTHRTFVAADIAANGAAAREKRRVRQIALGDEDVDAPA